MKKIIFFTVFLFYAAIACGQFLNNSSTSDINTIYHFKGAVKGDLGVMVSLRDTLNHPGTRFFGTLTVRPQDSLTGNPPLYMSNGLYWVQVGGGAVVANNYPTSLAFSAGILTVNRNGLSALTQNLNGWYIRYIDSSGLFPTKMFVANNYYPLTNPAGFIDSAYKLNDSMMRFSRNHNAVTWDVKTRSSTGSGAGANNYPSLISFSGGTLTLNRNGLSALTQNMDGRYVKYTDSSYFATKAFVANNYYPLTNPAGYVSSNNYPTSVSFTGGIFTINRNGLSALTQNMDGRYTKYTDSSALFATKAFTANNYYPISSNPQGYADSAYMINDSIMRFSRNHNATTWDVKVSAKKDTTFATNGIRMDLSVLPGKRALILDRQIYSATLDFASTAAQSSTDLTIAVPGATNGDVVSLGVPNASAPANSCYSAWVSAADVITVRFNNYSSGAIDPASGLFKVVDIKF